MSWNRKLWELMTPNFEKADPCYERGKVFRGYRNGYLPPPKVTVGSGPVEVEGYPR